MVWNFQRFLPWRRAASRDGSRSEESRRQPFAVGLVVAVPAAQGGVAGVGEKKFQGRRFNVAVAKHHVGFALMTCVTSFCAAVIILQAAGSPNDQSAIFYDSISAVEVVG